ncbi:SIR2 family protein [Mycolicibacterium fortuitum]|nr:SIR2 family protein [Mycolicibacterium fortuitum]
MAGHLYIINGDLTKVACDALLIPTDSSVYVENHWRPFLRSRGYSKAASWGPGDVFLSADEKMPHVWLGNIGQPDDHSDFSVFEPTVDAFVARATAKVDEVPASERISPWPKKRLAVNVVGSGQGGGRHKKGNLTLGLVRRLTDICAEREIDIVLVTHGEKPYAAAQRARFEVLGDGNEEQGWKFDDRANRDLIIEAKSLADEAKRNQLVLFIGAGISAGVGLPTWDQLLRDGARRAGFPPEHLEPLGRKDHRDQATLIDRRMRMTSGNQNGKGGSQFKADMAQKLSATGPYSLAHGLLASLPSKEAVTTNFDVLFEEACRIGDADIAVLPKNPRATNGRWLLKLHGSVDDPQRMVLTRSDYLDMPRRYGALMGLVQGLLMLRKMVFIGYSLSDEDFHELIDEVRSARGDAPETVRGTVLSLAEDALHKQLWDSDLDIVPMIVGDFDKGDPREIALASRELDLFLDLVGYLSTTSASFFLDETYSDLSAGERDIRDALKTLAKSTADTDLGPVGQQVKRFLTGLGASGD